MILGLIPARGGSKGIPRKNLRKIAGKPLIAWTIEAAQEASRLERFVVSTEDGEIAEVAREYGAEVLDRPQHLASDRATSLSVWQHTLNSIPASVLVNIYPTSPIRDQGLIDSVVKQFIDGDFTCVATGFSCKLMPFGAADDGTSKFYGRQDIEGFFCDDGNVYVVDARTVQSGMQYGGRLGRYFTNRECNIEIDEPFDFWLAEQVLTKRESGVRASRDRGVL